MKDLCTADFCGSDYAIINLEQKCDWNDCPVGFFGSEGGFSVVAENFASFLPILTIFSEPLENGDEEVYFGTGNDDNDLFPNDKIDRRSKETWQNYLDLLKKTFDLDYSPDTIDIINKNQQKARAKYQTAMLEWVDSMIK